MTASSSQLRRQQGPGECQGQLDLLRRSYVIIGGLLGSGSGSDHGPRRTPAPVALRDAGPTAPATPAAESRDNHRSTRDSREEAFCRAASELNDVVATTVSGGSRRSAVSKLSKPTMATRPRRSRSWTVRTAPIVQRLLSVNSAVGGALRKPLRTTSRRPCSSRWSLNWAASTSACRASASIRRAPARTI
jgi:hypothetical protein